MTRILIPVLVSALLLLAGPAMAVKVGEKAPGFTVMSNQGEVSLEQFAGKKNVILAFYFAINTPA
jgi:peroxiredoxin